MKYIFYFTLPILLCALILLTSCGGSSNKLLKVASTSIPHAEILEFVKPQLKEQDIDLEIVIVDDFNIQNRSLADGEIDANFFQHAPFLEAQVADFGYPLEPLVGVHLEPMALYSKKYKSLLDIPEGATIAIPSDPSNQARALALLEQKGLISLNSQETKTTLLDISSNPKQLKILEMDSALLTRALEDVDAGIFSTNFALLAGLSPQKDALAIENGRSRFVNIVVIRKGEGGRKDLQALKKALTGEDVQQFIQEHYRGAVLPVTKL